MSTRAQVIVKDKYGEIWFYRHSDGYPDGVKPTIKQFVDYVKAGHIRNNVEQASGWLIVLGHNEYIEQSPDYQKPLPEAGAFAWKVGAYEPSVPRKHGDVEYLYTIDLEALKVTYEDYEGNKHELDVS